MSSDNKLDDHLASTLDPSELEAINDEEYSAQEKAAMAKLAATLPEGDDDEDDFNEGDGQPVEGKGPPADDAAPAPAADDSDDQDDDTPTRADGPEPTVFRSELPADFDDQVKAIAAQEAELRQKFKDGDIELDEYEAEREKLGDQKDTLKQVKLEFDLSQKAEENFYRRQWEKTINGFFSTQAKSGAIDYNKDEAKRQDLDTFVRALGANAANADKPMDWFLQQAHKRVMALHGIQDGTKVETPADKLADAKNKRKAPIDAAPTNLSQVPGGDGPGDVAGEFADLDALEGEALEAAIADLARRNPAALEKFKSGR